MTADQRAIWEMYESIRKDAELAYYARFYKVLFAAIDVYNRAVERTGMQSAGLAALDAMGVQFQEVLRDMYTQTWPTAAANEFVRLTQATGVTVAGFNATGQVLEEMVGLQRIDRWQREAARFVESYGATFVREVTDTTKDIIRKTVLQGLDEGLGSKEIADLLRENWPDVSAVRALRIARTEAVSASNYGQKDGALQLIAETGIALSKIWISTEDDRTREDHRSDVMGGQAPPHDGFFIVGGERAEMPGDITLSAGMRVNCRCSVAYVPTEDVAELVQRPDLLEPNLAPNVRAARAKVAYQSLKASGLTRDAALEYIADACAVSPSTIRKDIWG